MTILLTGATGFIGKALLTRLRDEGRDVVALVRRAPAEGLGGPVRLLPDITDADALTIALRGGGTLIHAAGLAHTQADAQAHEAVNHRLPAALAAAAARAGVARFVLLSSVKAGAEESRAGRPLTEADASAPQTAYGQAKLAGETAVLAQPGLSAVVLRLPLVVGQDAKANMAALFALAARRLPLPFAGLTARRSLIARDSVVRAVMAVLKKPNGASGLFYLADAPALTLPEFVTAIRAGFGRPPGLMPAALAGLPWLGALPGFRDKLAALVRAHEVLPARFAAAYAWAPGDSQAGVSAAAEAWLRAQK